MIKIIDRYIFLELIEPFLFGLGCFTAILSCSMILFELVRAVILHGMSLLVALQIFIYRLPGVVVYIFPMATLLAALLAFSRLSHDSEIIAFRASGITLYRLVVPVAALGLLVSLANLTFSEIVVPESNKAAKNLLITAAVKRQPRLQKNVFIPEMDKGGLKRIIYTELVQGSNLNNVIIQEFTGGKLAQILTAKQATWNKDSNQWLFKEGTVYLVSDAGDFKHLIKFTEQYLTIKYSPSDFYVSEQNPDEMTIAQLRDFIALRQKMGAEVTDYQIQLNMKTAIPFASLVFALLGAPLGLSPRRTSGSIGLGISVIVIFFYYILTFISMAIGEVKVFPPWLAAWLPNILTGAGSWYILAKASEQ